MEILELLTELHFATFHDKVEWTKIIDESNSYCAQIGDKTILLKKKLSDTTKIIYFSASSPTTTFSNVSISDSYNGTDSEILYKKLDTLFTRIHNQWHKKRLPDMQNLIDNLKKLTKDIAR